MRPIDLEDAEAAVADDVVETVALVDDYVLAILAAAARVACVCFVVAIRTVAVLADAARGACRDAVVAAAAQLDSQWCHPYCFVLNEQKCLLFHLFPHVEEKLGLGLVGFGRVPVGGPRGPWLRCCSVQLPMPIVTTNLRRRKNARVRIRTIENTGREHLFNRKGWSQHAAWSECSKEIIGQFVTGLLRLSNFLP